MSPPIRVHSRVPRIGFVFNGQGGQWFAMGRELMCYASFEEDINRAGRYLHTLGCSWSPMDELLKPEASSNIDDPEFSQTLCTVLQVALVNLLRRFRVKPSAVVGHSSGEIAAAYAGGYLSCETAWKIAYFRGICSAELAKSHRRGAMMSVGLSEDDANDLLTRYAPASCAFGVTVACINSPCNVTLSGEGGLIDDLGEILEGNQVFARKLRVPLAYHSQQMGVVSSKFESSLESLAPSDAIGACVPMLSTVTGERIAASRLHEPSYWALNMVSPVRFDQAVQAMCAHAELALAKKIDMSHRHVSVVDHILEIGPHATLQVILREILRGFPRGQSIECNSVLRKGHSAKKTLLEAMGTLHCMGVPLKLREINGPAPAGQQRKPPISMLVNLPEYPFDHSQRYWHESRLSRNYRLRSHAPSELLGARSRDWNASEARWRLFIRTAEVPWVDQHVVNGAALYPGAGMLVMAIEAAKQLVNDEEGHSIDSYTLHAVQILAPIYPDANAEVQTSMRGTKAIGKSEITFEFFIRTCTANGDWLLNCRGLISVSLSDNWDDWEGQKTEEQRQLVAAEYSVLASRCLAHVDAQNMYRFLSRHGYDYGPVFQAARHQRCNEGSREAAAEVTLFQSTEERHVIHPVSLDAILHLSLTALTSGGRRIMPTSMPSRVGYLWVSSKGLSRWDNDSITTFSAVTNVNRRSFTFKGAALEQQGAEKKLRLWVEDVKMTNVTTTPTTDLLPNPEQFCMGIECKPALSKLTPKEVDVLLREMHPVPRDESAFFRDLQLLVRKSLRRLLVTKPLDSSEEPWKTQYWRWAEHHTAQTGHLDSDTDQIFFEDLCHRMRSTNNVGRLYEAVASNLSALMHGTVDPLELLLQSGLLKDYYNMLANFRCAKQAASYMNLLAHQTPGLTILEIGGGTGSATRNMLGALRSNPDDKTLRCSRYDFTDVSSAFLDKAREEFAPYSAQMTFGTLNVEQDITEQGFQRGSYDVVVADNVLHITSNLAKTLQNVRSVLKPGGKVIIHELLDPSGWTAGFVFGLLPGWWLGTQDNRVLSPSISAKDWDVVLKGNGFSGADIVLRDFEDDVAHHLGHIISTATTEKDAPSESRHVGQATIIVKQGCTEQLSIAMDLVLSLQGLVGCTARVLNIEEALSGDRYMDPDELGIFLADYKASFLGSLDDSTWKFLKTLVQGCRHLLWVSDGGGQTPDPEYGILDGLARTLRSETYDLHLVTLALDVDSSHNTRLVMQVVQDMIDTWSGNYEEEYVVIDGRLQTRRLVAAHHLKSAMDARLLPYETISTSLADKRRFYMSTESRTGFDTTPYYSECIFPAKEEEEEGGGDGDNIVEILVKAVCLQSCESDLARNPEADSEFGSFCAGTVLLAGPATAFEPGDRVFAACKGCFRSHVRVVSTSVTKIPPDLSFADACQTAPSRLLAYNALVEVGQVRDTDIILIDDGASPIGQAALRLLLSDCAAKEVWVTAAGQKDHAQILKYSGILEQRILPASWFDTKMIIASQWKHKFDVVFSPARESRASSLLDLVRVGGRYIMLSATSESLGEVPCVPSDVSLSIIHLGDVSTKPNALQYAVVLPPLSSLENTAQNTSHFFASDLTRSFNHLRNVSYRESIVVELDDASNIEVRVKPRLKYSFDSQATYMIVGGLGGLGREMARWLASRGARYLILPSRSGPRSKEAQQLITELRNMHVHVETPCCDMADRAALQAMLVGCSTMPPIKGCIQAAMVMTELVFQKMRFSHWRATIDSKVKVSWNLHLELPRNLDFFVLISSMMGIIGSPSLAAYNAGNTYQDTLARYRVLQGERAVSINLGAVPDAGYLVENEKHRYIPSMKRTKKYALTYVKELCVLLDIFCGPGNSSSSQNCQAIVGIRPPAHWKHLEEVPMTMSRPFWGHMHHIPGPGLDKLQLLDNQARQKYSLNEIGDKITAAGSLKEAAEIVSETLAGRLVAILGTSYDRLDPEKPLHSYGMDSLSAIDLRNWVGKAFDVDLPVSEIFGGLTLGNAAMAIVQKMAGNKN